MASQSMCDFLHTGLMYQDKEKKIPSFYVDVVDRFKKKGWVVGETLFGAPYDWRFAGDRIDSYVVYHSTEMGRLD